MVHVLWTNYDLVYRNCNNLRYNLTWQGSEASNRATDNPRHHENLIFRNRTRSPFNRCELSRVTYQRKDYYRWRILPRGHCQERVTDMSLAGSYYRQCPTATEDDSGRRGNCYSRRERRQSRLVGDWTVPDQFTFTFRVELRMTVIDRHQGHGSGCTICIHRCSFVFIAPWPWLRRCSSVLFLSFK